VLLKDVSVIIPISLNDEPRAQAFNWIKKFYENMFPEVELCIGVCNEKPFSKAKVINKTVEKSKGDILVIADADLFFEPSLLEESIKQLETRAWVIPFKRVLNISKESTHDLLETEPQWPVPINLETHPRRYAAMGGINIVPRQHFETVGGFDERFVGWGGEDDAFAASLNNLCGYVKRMDATLYHLWHERNNGGYYGANRQLLKAYYAGKESIQREIEKRRGKMS
jgi:predicted glycosyltransferase involved in capsule biosynthesis